jgi:hypothetical protein
MRRGRGDIVIVCGVVVVVLVLVRDGGRYAGDARGWIDQLT